MINVHTPEHATGRTVIAFRIADENFSACREEAVRWEFDGKTAEGRVQVHCFNPGEHSITLRIGERIETVSLSIPTSINRKVIRIETQAQLDELMLTDDLTVVFTAGEFVLGKPLIVSNRKNVEFRCGEGIATLVAGFEGSMVASNAASSNVIFHQIGFKGAGGSKRNHGVYAAGTGLALVGCIFDRLYNAVFGSASASIVLMDSCRESSQLAGHFAYIVGNEWVMRDCEVPFGSAGENAIRIPGPDKGIGPAARFVGIYNTSVTSNMKSAFNPRTPDGMDIINCTSKGNNSGAGVMSIGPRNNPAFVARDVIVRRCTGVDASIVLGPGTSDIVVDECNVTTNGWAPLVLATVEAGIATPFLGPWTIRNCRFNASNVRLKAPALWSFSKNISNEEKVKIVQNVTWENNFYNGVISPRQFQP